MLDLRPYARCGPRLSDYLPWAADCIVAPPGAGPMQSTFEARIPGGEPGPLRLNARVAPGVVLNKDGAFQRTLAFRGPDLDSATLSELMGQSVRLNNALRRFGSGWCLHMEARRRPSPGYPDSDFAHALAWLIDEERRAVFEAAGARFESDYFLTLSFLPPPERQGRLEALLFEGGGQSEAGPNYRAHLARFLEESDQLLALLQTLMPAADWLGDAETLGYLHDCVSDRRLGRLAVPPHPFHLDALLTDAPLIGGLAPKEAFSLLLRRHQEKERGEKPKTYIN